MQGCTNGCTQFHAKTSIQLHYVNSTKCSFWHHLFCETRICGLATQEYDKYDTMTESPNFSSYGIQWRSQSITSRRIILTGGQMWIEEGDPYILGASLFIPNMPPFLIKTTVGHNQMTKQF